MTALALLVVTACSGGSDDGADASIPGATTGGTEPLFDPNGTAVVPGTAVQLDDGVIIATDDGVVPTPTTEPPVDPTGPDALPTGEATATSAPVIPLPDPATVGRIVSMSPTHTETLFALGLGDFVVAVDSESNFPAEADSVRRDDLSAASADLSTLLSLDPDVVIVGDDPTGLVGRLNAAGVPSYSGAPPASLADVYTQIVDIASIVGRPDAGEELVASMQADIAAIVGAVPPGQRTYFHEIDPSLVTITPGSFLDSVYAQLGLVSIVGVADPSGVAQLSSEQVVAANPAVILLADAECCDVTIDRIASRPGWAAISAVSDGAVVALPDDLTMRWGPRVVEFVRTVAGAVAAAG